ncbi:hypothetical protein, partial [Aquitalea magnusonii]|uniref:hypothetical protein n=1 Tax=Aquitalea magnusonii TaxID=332411 RepID=UPI00137B5E06
TRIGYDYYNLFGKGWTGSVLLDWKKQRPQSQLPGTRIGYDYYNLFGKGWTGSVLLDWKKQRPQSQL